MQTPALPLGYAAPTRNYGIKDSGLGISNSPTIDSPRSFESLISDPQSRSFAVSVERETGLEPATFSLARRRSTSELLPLDSPSIILTRRGRKKTRPEQDPVHHAVHGLRKKRNQISKTTTTHPTQSTASPPFMVRVMRRAAEPVRSGA